MDVRRIRADEVDAYREMRLRALTLAPDAYGTTLEDALAREYADWEGFVLRAATAEELALFVLDRDDGTLAGSAAAMANPDHDDTGDMAIVQMWLDEDLRGAGWADALLAAAEGHARSCGRAACALWVVARNARARRFYERQGYVATGETQPDRSGGLELLMRRALG